MLSLQAVLAGGVGPRDSVLWDFEPEGTAGLATLKAALGPCAGLRVRDLARTCVLWPVLASVEAVFSFLLVEGVALSVDGAEWLGFVGAAGSRARWGGLKTF